MAGTRQPVELIISKGKKHLTKKEITERTLSEPKPLTDDIAPPSYLTAKQKKSFAKLATQLLKLNTMGETDCEVLARYVVAEHQYEAATKELRDLAKKKPHDPGRDADGDAKKEYYTLLELWTGSSESVARLQDRYFRQAQSAARELGLTISSRCKLVVPQSDITAEKPANKFSRFEA